MTDAQQYLTNIAFGVGTCNVPGAAGQVGDLSRADTRKCFSIIAAQAGIVGFQELEEVEDHEDLATVLPQTDWYLQHPDSENEIAIKRNRWRIVADTDVRLNGVPPIAQQHLSDGKTGVSPERNLTWCIWEFRENPLFTLTAIVDTHLVSGVYPGNDNLAWRQAARDEEFQGIVRWVTFLINHGINVIFVGDTNWTTMPKPVPTWQWFINDSIDKIAYCQTPKSNYDLQFISAERFANPSDHDFRVANVAAVANSLYVPPAPWWTKVAAPLEAVFSDAVRKNPALTKTDALLALDPVISWKLGQQTTATKTTKGK